MIRSRYLPLLAVCGIASVGCGSAVSVPIEPGDEAPAAWEAGSAKSLEEAETSSDEVALTKTTAIVLTSGSSAAAISPVEDAAPERTFAVEGPGDAVRVSFDDLDLMKVLSLPEGDVPADVADDFPAWLSGLDGQQVRLRGFMYPTYEATGITGFLLARDNEICCFGRDPKIYDILPVRLDAGEETDYIQGRPFDVVGTFHVDPADDEGELYKLYSIDGAKVVQ